MQQSRALLGADLSIRSLHPPSAETEQFLQNLPGEQVRETRFLSMVRHPASGAVRLSHIRALSGPFPFYGDFVTEPEEAADRFLSGTGWAVVEENLWLQFDLSVGDTLRIGEADFRIAGRLIRVSGEPPFTSAFLGPRIFISSEDLPRTELLREDSLARYYTHVKTGTEAEADALVARYRNEWSARRLEVETPDERRAMTGDALANVGRFLSLSAFAALILGGIGLASAIQLYVRRKRDTVAVLRCLGADAHTAFSIYLIQALAVALVGATGGALLGGSTQHVIPWLLSDVLPIPVSASWSWSTALLSLLFGAGMAASFALLPLVPLRRTSPLRALRTAVEDAGLRMQVDVLQWGLVLALAGALTAFAIAHTEKWTQGVLTAVALGLLLALLAGVARLLIFTARHAARGALSFPWRQGIANLHRPYNQTVSLLLALSFGTFLLATLSFTQQNILRQFRTSTEDGQPNVILFDVQRDQIAAIEDILSEAGQTLAESTPIITMRLLSVNDRTVGELRDDPDLDIPDWLLFREYRTTYRETPADSGHLIAGQWQGRHSDPARRIPVSIEQTMAGHLGIGLGARLVFDLQGVRLHTRVHSIRKVDWRQLRTNFLVLFPAGILEEAPQYYAMVVRAPTAADAAKIQSHIIDRFPNVSAVDLRMLLESLDRMLNQAAFVVRFMAWFSLLTGLMVLCAMVVTHRYDRKDETDLLRTLGATEGQCRRIMMSEYLALGSVAAGGGMLLAAAAAAGISRWIFDLAFTVHAPTLLGTPVAVVAATLAVGWLTEGISGVRLKAGQRYS